MDERTGEKTGEKTVRWMGERIAGGWAKEAEQMTGRKNRQASRRRVRRTGGITGQKPRRSRDKRMAGRSSLRAEKVGRNEQRAFKNRRVADTSTRLPISLFYGFPISIRYNVIAPVATSTRETMLIAIHSNAATISPIANFTPASFRAFAYNTNPGR